MMSLNPCLFSHNSDFWKTPKAIYDRFMDQGYFDPCPVNPTFDGLAIKWKEKNFVNPPYSEISLWVSKAIIEHRQGKEVILLVPSRTDTRWFHRCMEEGAVFEFVKGRLCFDDCGKPAPFPSVFIKLL